jgi:type IV secretory pathway VirB10-like protein
MNFQQVKQANGNNVTMFGTFNEVGGVSFTQNQKQVCKCQVTDDNNEKHLVRLYGTMPTPALQNMRQEFSLSSYQGVTRTTGQPYTGYSGFWNDRAMVNQVPANAPPAPYTAPPVPQAPPVSYNAPQTPQNRPQQPNVPQQGMNMPDTYAYPVTPETARRMARTAFMAAMLQNGQSPLLSYVTELVEYSYTGIEPSKGGQPNPDYVGDNPPEVDEDGIPF